MATFNDKNGKTWIVALDAPTIRAVRRECLVDLAGLDGAAYESLVNDPVLLVDALWVICREQALRDGVTDVQFGRALVGDAIEAATSAMLESIADFFPGTKKELLVAIAAKNAKLREIGVASALAKLNDPELEATIIASMEAEMDQAIRDQLKKPKNQSTPSTKPTSSPDSSESPPRE